MIGVFGPGPLLAVALFSLLAVGLYALGGRMAPRGNDSPGKHRPYACGEDLAPEQVRLSYPRYFRIVLMFAVVHVGTLVVALLSMTRSGRWLATLFLLTVAVCVDILVSGDRHVA